MPYQDDFGRTINYLRVSVTDRCNLRCLYCMPPTGVPKLNHDDILRYEELALVVRAAVSLGISKVRLTGGEPLARLGLAQFVRMISHLSGLDDVALTTNGTLLARQAQELANAGLRRVNISLDTLRPDRFRLITRGGDLDDVWAGVAAAQKAGLVPTKFNMVVVRGINDDEVVDMAKRSLLYGWHVRFIELMPIGVSAEWEGHGTVPNQEVRARIEAALGSLQPVRGPAGNGPARYYRLSGTDGTIGFIGALSHHFCDTCNRIRLTADGRLRPCLMDDREIDVRHALRAGAGLEELRQLLAEAIRSKPERHHLDQAQVPQQRSMAQIGG